MNSDSFCLVCIEPLSSSPLDCKCLICTHCLAGWLTHTTKENLLTGDKCIRCPNELCSRTYPIDIILPKISPEENEKVSELLLKNYLYGAPDIVSCPRKSCNYYGLMASESCSDDLTCELCGHRWKDRSQLSFFEKFLYILVNLGTIISELQTNIYHMIYTVQCPKCSIPIRKAGGCAHMVCRKCSHEFCWDCKQEYMHHSKNHCLAHKFVRASIIGFAFFYLGILMGIYVMIWNLWMVALKLLMKLCLLNSIGLVSILLIYPILRLCKEEESIFEDRLKTVWYVSWFAIMAYITFWHLHYLLSNHYSELLLAIGVEVCLIWTVKNIDFLVQTWLKYVF